MGISKDIAYIKGFIEGTDFNAESNEGRIIMGLIMFAEHAAKRVEELEDALEMVVGRMDALDKFTKLLKEDILLLDDDVYKLVMKEKGYYPKDDDYDDEEFEDEGDDDNLFEIMCPECGEDVVVDFDMLEDENSITCPNCQSKIELEFDMDVNRPDDEDIDD